MIRFECDYNNGCHEKVLKALVETNDLRTPGYGNDELCKEAADIIRDICKCPEAAVHFIPGGTQANTIVIKSLLRAHQGVVSPESGHISVHETGAIEAVGHEVLTLKPENGKISAAQVDEYCAKHYADESWDHLTQPGMVYISHPTEMGTLYTKAELTALREVCDKYDMPLYLDGARLGYGISSVDSDVTMEDIAALCDVFYIGGTKVGALFGEAVVITKTRYQKDFRYLIKQHGAMFAKGRLMGVQFKALLEDGLYFEIGKKADEQAYRIRDAFMAKGFEMLMFSPTNQQFVIVDKESLKKLAEKYTFATWEDLGDKASVRFCTSWATTDAEVDELVKDIEAL